MESGRVTMAEDRVRTAGQDGGQPAATEGDRGVAHGVDAAVDPVQAAAVGAVLDRVPAISEGVQLRPRHDPMVA